MRTLTMAWFGLFVVASADSAGEVSFTTKPEISKSADKVSIAFAVSAPTDVEVAVLGADGKVVRHLAAGVLGGQYPPPPPLKAGLTQVLDWDGKDDYGQPVPAALTVRVRAGMGVSLAQIVGGNPYAYYSEDMRHYDHSPWGITGLEARGDGKVYVLGHSSNLGPMALRQYDIDGNYLRTVFPPPAGKEPAKMKGWGINHRPDGAYTPKFNRLVDPSPTTTFLDAQVFSMARLLPTPDQNRLSLWRTGQTGTFDTLSINTDGTISDDPAERSPGPLVKNPPLPAGPVEPGSHFVHALLGPVFTCFTPDGKSFYLSGVYAATTRYGTVQEIKTDGFWRDGQVWKVDAATRTAKPFFALEAKSIPPKGKERVAAYGGMDSYATLHGVAVDRDENVFVCDRLNRRVVVLDKSGKTIRQIPVEHPDAIALSARTGALYVTTRLGDYHARGAVQLLKFNDWRQDEKPGVALEVSKTGYTGHHKCSYVAVCETAQASNVWVAYTEMPVRIYRDDGNGLTLLKDFYRVAGAQRCLGFDRMQVDQQTDEVYVLDDHDAVWKIGDWKDPQMVKLPLQTASIAIDSRRRHIYIRTLADGASSYSVGKAARFHLDRQGYPPANFGDSGTNRVTPPFQYEWCFEGNSDQGMAVAPNGNLAVVGSPKDGLRVFSGSQTKAPWEATTVAKLPALAGGVRFDLAGNLYVGYVDKKPTTPLPGFESDKYLPALGRIHKYGPTGTLANGNLFPKAPASPSHSYDVQFGAFEVDCVTRSPRFGVDGYGRICFPTNIVPRVTLIDNAGNEILQFGTYGNRDSLGGLAGDLAPTKDIPLGFPNSVDATDDHIYVADMVNLRLLRVAKMFKLETSAKVP